MPANWQAQWIVAACQLFCSSRDQMVAGLELQRVEARHQRRNPAVPFGIGEAHAAIDDRERMGIARDAGEEACAEIEHGWWRFGLGVPCTARVLNVHPMNKHDLQPETGPTARRQCAAAGPHLAGLARPSRGPRPAGGAQAERRPEVRDRGLCQAARRAARHGVPQARRPCDPGGVRARLRPRLDGRGDGRRAVRNAGANSRRPRKIRCRGTR